MVSVNGMTIPSKLAELIQWVNWRDLSGRKVPFQPSGIPAKSNDQETWNPLDDVCEALPNHTGIGFVFRNGIVGIDLDGCISDGQVSHWAQQILDRFRETFAEISPSGTGVHIIASGTLSGAKGKKFPVSAPKVGDKSPGVEIYETGRFFCFTGQLLEGHASEVTDQQAAIDWLIDDFSQRKSTDPNGLEPLDVARWLSRRGVTVVQTDSQPDGTRRWFIPCPNATTHSTPDGPRDCVITQEAGGRLGGNCFHKSCGMTDWHALSAAIGKPEWEDYHLTAGPEVDVSALVSSDAETKKTAQITDNCSVFPAECLRPDGLLGEIIDYTLATSLYPQPELALAGALALLGTITGRKVRDRHDTRTNVYVLGVGLSGTGKERARQTNKKLLTLSCGAELLGSERVGSHAGIVTTVSGTPACLMQLDEMGRLLETCKDPRKAPHLFNCITVLMQIYTSSDTIWKADAYADAKKVKTIDQPHLVIYGTATPDSFWRSLSTDNIAEGLMGRLLVFEGRGYEVKMRDETQVMDPPHQLLESIRYWLDLRTGGNLAEIAPVPKLIPHTPEAQERFREHVHGINERRTSEDHLRAALWSRCGEKSAKLALIHACSRAVCVPETITLTDVNWGIKLANWLTRRLLVGCDQNVSENEVESREKRILRLVGKNGLSSYELSRKTRWIRPRERQEILSDLIGCGMLEAVEIPTKGRPKVIYKLPATYRPSDGR